MGAIAAAIALHAVALILRPGVSGGHVSAPLTSTSVLAVRIVPAAPSTNPHSKAEATQTALSSATPERRPDPAAEPRTNGGAATAVDRVEEKQDARVSARSSSQVDPAAKTGTALSPAPAYALGIQLDPGPRPLDEIEPEYTDPVNLRSGTVVLRLLISDTGHVDEVGVVRADPPGVFEQAAIEAFSKARFAPGMAGGRAVKSQIRIEVEFMPINRGARTSGRSY